MKPDICFSVFSHVRHVRQILAHVRDQVRRFYGNCRTLSVYVILQTKKFYQKFL